MFETKKPPTDADAIRATIQALLDAGYVLDYVNDGDDEVEVSTLEEALEAITAVDVATLIVDHPTERSSFVFFVQGNEPEEVICDHGVSLSPVLDPLTESWWS